MDTESGFRDVVFVTAAYGLGETVVQGAVNPDEFYVYKPTLDAGRPSDITSNAWFKIDQNVVRGFVKPAGRSRRLMLTPQTVVSSVLQMQRSNRLRAKR